MQALRKSTWLARLFLAWFALTLGAAIAAPLVERQAVVLLCAEGGAPKLLVVGEDGKLVQAVHPPALHCPLCLAAALPLPEVTSFAVGAEPPPVFATAWRIESPTAWTPGAPMPARGPPAGRANG